MEVRGTNINLIESIFALNCTEKDLVNMKLVFDATKEKQRQNKCLLVGIQRKITKIDDKLQDKKVIVDLFTQEP